MTTFSVQSGRVYWQTPEGPARLRAEDVDAILAILHANGLKATWLDLDQAAQAAGYPPAVSSLIATRAA